MTRLPRLFIIVSVSHLMNADGDPFPFRIKVPISHNPDDVHFLYHEIIREADTKTAAVFSWTFDNGVRFCYAGRKGAEHTTVVGNERDFTSQWLRMKLGESLEKYLLANVVSSFVPLNPPKGESK